MSHDFTLTHDYPVLVDSKVQPWMDYPLLRCDVSKHVQEFFANATGRTGSTRKRHRGNLSS